MDFAYHIDCEQHALYITCAGFFTIDDLVATAKRLQPILSQHQGYNVIADLRRAHAEFPARRLQLLTARLSRKLFSDCMLAFLLAYPVETALAILCQQALHKTVVIRIFSTEEGLSEYLKYDASPMLETVAEQLTKSCPA